MSLYSSNKCLFLSRLITTRAKTGGRSTSRKGARRPGTARSGTASAHGATKCLPKWLGYEPRLIAVSLDSAFTRCAPCALFRSKVDGVVPYTQHVNLRITPVPRNPNLYQGRTLNPRPSTPIPFILSPQQPHPCTQVLHEREHSGGHAGFDP